MIEAEDGVVEVDVEELPVAVEVGEAVVKVVDLPPILALVLVISAARWDTFHASVPREVGINVSTVREKDTCRENAPSQELPAGAAEAEEAVVVVKVVEVPFHVTTVREKDTCQENAQSLALVINVTTVRKMDTCLVSAPNQAAEVVAVPEVVVVPEDVAVILLAALTLNQLSIIRK